VTDASSQFGALPSEPLLRIWSLHRSSPAACRARACVSLTSQSSAVIDMYCTAHNKPLPSEVCSSCQSKQHGRCGLPLNFAYCGRTGLVCSVIIFLPTLLTVSTFHPGCLFVGTDYSGCERYAVLQALHILGRSYWLLAHSSCAICWTVCGPPREGL
jgi:hypothetical protein